MQSKVIIRSKLVVGNWELIPMESGAELSDPWDIATVEYELYSIFYIF